jgi:hypothetical protein
MSLSRVTTRRRPLPSLPCPLCGETIHPRPGRIIKAGRWTDCLRRRERCRVGISNARSNSTILHGDQVWLLRALTRILGRRSMRSVPSKH